MFVLSVVVANAITSIVCSASNTVARFRRIRHSILICLLAPVSKRFRFRKCRMHLRRFHLSMPCKRSIGCKCEPKIHVVVKEINFLRLREINFRLEKTALQCNILILFYKYHEIWIQSNVKLKRMVNIIINMTG